MLIYQGCVNTMLTFSPTPTANLIAKVFFFSLSFYFLSIFLDMKTLIPMSATFLTLIILAIGTV